MLCPLRDGWSLSGVCDRDADWLIAAAYVTLMNPTDKRETAGNRTIEFFMFCWNYDLLLAHRCANEERSLYKWPFAKLDR